MYWSPTDQPDIYARLGDEYGEDYIGGFLGGFDKINLPLRGERTDEFMAGFEDGQDAARLVFGVA
jgi:hypothetical protein